MARQLVSLDDDLIRSLEQLVGVLFPNWELTQLPAQGASVVADFIDGAREFFMYVRPFADARSCASQLVADNPELQGGQS